MKINKNKIYIIAGLLFTQPLYANNDVSNFATSTNASSTVVEEVSIEDQTIASLEYSTASFEYKDDKKNIDENKIFEDVNDEDEEVGTFTIDKCSNEDGECSILLNTTDTNCNGSKFFKVDGLKLRRNNQAIDYEKDKVLKVCYKVNSGNKEYNNLSIDFSVNDLWDTNPVPSDIIVDKFNENKKIYINGTCNIEDYNFGKINVIDSGDLREEGYDKDSHIFNTFGEFSDGFKEEDGDLIGSINFDNEDTINKIQKIIGLSAIDTSEGTKDVELSFIFDHNDTPTDININKNSITGSFKKDIDVFELNTLDFDGLNTCITSNIDSYKYNIVSQDSNLFKVVGSHLQFKNDFENPNEDLEYSITISSNDGDSSFEKTFTLNLKSNSEVNDLFLNDDSYYGEIEADEIVTKLVTSDSDYSTIQGKHIFMLDGDNSEDNDLINITEDGFISFKNDMTFGFFGNAKDEYTFKFIVSDGDTEYKETIKYKQYEPNKYLDGITLSEFNILDINSDSIIGEIITPKDSENYTFTFTGSENNNNLFKLTTIDGKEFIKIGNNSLENKTQVYKIELDIEHDKGDIANKTFYLYQKANKIPEGIYIDSVSENKGLIKENTLLGSIKIIDDSNPDDITLTLLDGNDYLKILKENGKYNIYSATELENKNYTYDMIIEVNDGLNTKNFNLSITTIQYFAPVDGINLNINNSISGITSEIINGLYVFTISDYIRGGLIDIEYKDISGNTDVQFEPVSLTLEGVYSDMFEIDNETHQLKFKDNTIIVDGTYNLTIVSNSGGIISKKNITIIVDINLAKIVNITLDNNVILPNYSENLLIGNLESIYDKDYDGETTYKLLTDEDIDNTIIPYYNGIQNLSLLKDNDNQYFKIVDGKLSIKDSDTILPQETNFEISVKGTSENGGEFITKVLVNYFGAVITSTTYTSNDLKMQFSLGGHHIYTRYYQIDKPGIMEISDSVHTTYSKNANIRIPANKATVYNCTKSTEGEWREFDENEIYHIDINTDLDIDSSNEGELTIDADRENTEIIFGTDTYNIKNKNIKILYNTGAVELYLNDELEKSYELISDSPNYDGNIFRVTYNDVDKKVTVYKKLFRKISLGTGRSSPNEYDIYHATSGDNSGWSSCATPTEDNTANYCTSLKYWIHNQYHETTTDIKLRSVDVNCVIYEFSDGEEYNGTTSVTESSFDHVVATDMSKDDFTINGENFRATDWGTNIFATDKINLDGIKLNTIGEFGSTILKINKIKVDIINSDDFTVGTSGIIDYNFDEVGQILTLNDLEIKATENIGGFNVGDIVTKKAGNYHMSLYYYMGDQLVMNDLFPLTIVATNNISLTGALSINKDSIDIYADNESKYTLCNEVVDNYGNSINGEYSGLSTDLIYLSGGIDQNLENGFEQAVNVSGVTISDSKICFDLTSVTPGTFTPNIDISFPEHELYDDELRLYYQDLNITTSDEIVFKQPIIGTLNITDCNGKDYPEIDHGCTYNITLTNLSGISNIAGSIDMDNNIIQDSFKQLIDGHFWKTIGSINTNFDIQNGVFPNFTGLISASDNTLKNPIIQNVKGLTLRYILDNKVIGYRLNQFPIIGKGVDIETTNPEDLNIDGIESNDNLGLDVIGSLQSDGNAIGSGFDKNFSKINKGEIRKTIRENAYIAIKGVSPSKTRSYNGIVYYEGDLKYSDIKDLDFETVIVKNGNFIINSDINNLIGIIVLSDGYNVFEDYKTAGNVYVDSNVRYINAAIYADGGFMSSNYGVLLDDPITRTDKLSRQLIMKGSLFTRNTIGGSLMIGGNYKLPGGEKTNNYELSLVFDLNNIRLGNDGCEENEEGVCINNNNFIIKYDPNIQINPPKLFSK